MHNDTSRRRGLEGTLGTEEQNVGRAEGSGAKTRGGTQDSLAMRAAVIISAGGKAGETGGHAAQKANSTVLEGVAWSIAGRGNVEGVRSLEMIEGCEYNNPHGGSPVQVCLALALLQKR